MQSSRADDAYDVKVPVELITAGYWTIDATPTPPGSARPGYLDYVRMCERHADSDKTARDVVDNLLRACAGATSEVHLNVVGHGESGKIHTGSGGIGTDQELYISSDNVDSVCKPLRKLRGHAGSLRLWSCMTGEGDAGAELLAALAEILRCKCYAPTGVIKCFTPCRFALQTGSKWLCAKPGRGLPHSVGMPTIEPPFAVTIWSMAVSPTMSISLDQVLRVRFTRRDGVVRNVESADARSLLQKVNVAQPQALTGGIGAATTAQMELTYKSRDDREASKSFVVYNDCILMSVSDSTYYWCDPAFMPTAFA